MSGSGEAGAVHGLVGWVVVGVGRGQLRQIQTHALALAEQLQQEQLGGIRTNQVTRVTRRVLLLCQ